MVVDDNSDMIKSSLSSVMKTMVMAVAVSMIIIWLFFGDLKGLPDRWYFHPDLHSDSAGCHERSGILLNVITFKPLVLGVGMMVDNSIVVLRAASVPRKALASVNIPRQPLEGSGIVLNRSLVVPLPPRVVFIPLALLEGMVRTDV